MATVGAGTSAGEAGAFRVVVVALVANLSIAVVKFGAFLISGSTAMLTEGIHSLVDTTDQALLLIGQKRGARPANASHPFGYGLETYFWSFVVALMIFFSGGAVAIWQGVVKIIDPQPIERPEVSLAVLGVAAVVEGWSFRTAYREFRRLVRPRRVTLVRFLKLSKDPNVIATLLEDSAALAGLFLAAAGVVAAGYLHVEWADGAASVAIGLALVAVAIFLTNEIRSLIAGEAALPVIEDEVRRALAGCDGHGRLVDLKTLHLGPHDILAVVRWSFPDGSTAADLDTAAATVEAHIRQADDRFTHVMFEAPFVARRDQATAKPS